MQFRLVYEGPLKANGTPAAKHSIRQIVHAQLQELVDRKAMAHLKQKIAEGSPTITRVSVGSYTFVPLISEKLDHVAELNITFLTPEEPGRVITQGGDLDNRLKTLLDALRCPKNLGELPNGSTPAKFEAPFYCLLEDDALVSGLTISTDRLLKKNVDSSHVLLVIEVIPRSTRTTLGTVTWV